MTDLNQLLWIVISTLALGYIVGSLLPAPAPEPAREPTREEFDRILRRWLGPKA
jgi:hypothetical protein